MRSDYHPIGRVKDRLVLLVPADAIVPVPVAAEQFDDLSASRPVSGQPAGLDPISYVCASGCLLGGHLFTSQEI
jgi:hypothetical protein